MLTVGQVQGGLAQGIGQALLEHTVYDAGSGQLLSGSLLDYALPRADDLPPSTSPSPIADRGKPARRQGRRPGRVHRRAADLVNAILDALAPLGIEHIDMPATPERIWRAIRGAPQS